MTMLQYSGGSRLTGYTVLNDPDVGIEERETVSCVHCQYTWQMQPGSGRKRGYCFKCNGLICGKKRCMDSCQPFEKQIEVQEAASRAVEGILHESGAEQLFEANKRAIEEMERKEQLWRQLRKR